PTLTNERVGQRSGVSPIVESLRSQNQRKVRSWSVSRNAACGAVILYAGEGTARARAGGSAPVGGDALDGVTVTIGGFAGTDVAVDGLLGGGVVVLDCAAASPRGPAASASATSPASTGRD